MGFLWIGFQEGRKAVRVLRVANLVLPDHRPLQFPPFLQRNRGGEACSIFETPPCEPVDVFDISLSFMLSSSFRPLALQRKGGIVVDSCSGRMKSSASSCLVNLVLSKLLSLIVNPGLVS